MSFASASLLNDTSAANEVSRAGVTSWMQIVEGVADLMEKCVIREGTGGAVMLLSGEWVRAHKDSCTKSLTQPCLVALSPPRPILTVFMWRTDGYFDTIWNDYQTHPHGVRPINPRDLSGNVTTVPQDSGIGTSNISVT